MGVSRDLATDIARTIDADGFDAPSRPSGSMGMMVPNWYWIIRDDDLEFAKSLTTGLAAAATSSLWDGTVSTSAIAGLVGGLLNTARAARAKGVQVPALTYKLLLALKTRKEGLSVDEATELLNVMFEDSPPLRASDIRDILTNLSATRVGDGSVIAFVGTDCDGRWHGSGV